MATKCFWVGFAIYWSYLLFSRLHCTWTSPKVLWEDCRDIPLSSSWNHPWKQVFMHLAQCNWVGDSQTWTDGNMVHLGTPVKCLSRSEGWSETLHFCQVTRHCCWFLGHSLRSKTLCKQLARKCRVLEHRGCGGEDESHASWTHAWPLSTRDASFIERNIYKTYLTEMLGK